MKLRLQASVILSSLALVSFGAIPANAILLIGNSENDSIIKFDEGTASAIGNFTAPGSGGLSAPDALTFGPDGNLYVSSGGNSSLNLFDPLYPKNSAVLKYSPTGDFLGVAASGAGLTRPYGNAFGPDGSLYVSSFRTNQILRYDTNGSFLGVFASDNNGGFGTKNGLNGPNGLLFAPDGSLYVTTEGTANDAKGDLAFAFESQVVRYSPEQVAGLAPTTAPSVFVAQPTPLKESFGFVSLLGLAIAPDEQSLFVSDFAGGIRQYDFAGQLVSTLSTNYTGTAPSSNFIGSLTFGSGENSNNLYAIGFNNAAGQDNIGSVLAYKDAKGSATKFTGIATTDSSLKRPIGVTAVRRSVEPVPEPATIYSTLVVLGGLGMVARRRRKASTK
ncbi:MAG: PEP-CTERM sorting domain-containing protein [Oscillatoriophycideae cyanobacterium NC_groundwater_1537_Pr4_S-0.65um_50_18]|nr:PEP-CTERM sorting domain-containing protein [Oscillatoriophycideae cyanobacterium NC_groundwater_1537_Pr4_S-0.65um_50_18]